MSWPLKGEWNLRDKEENQRIKVMAEEMYKAWPRDDFFFPFRMSLSPRKHNEINTVHQKQCRVAVMSIAFGVRDLWI